MVEGSGYALSTIAAYIDLNAVRAGIVEDPLEYRQSTVCPRWLPLAPLAQKDFAAIAIIDYRDDALHVPWQVKRAHGHDKPFGADWLFGVYGLLSSAAAPASV